ncbi:hypothetical protein [Sphingomonas rubra]|uniref:Uncharacterized protein n=1 Tax=Sphingomonas rubra TaxID=634430 RepID=A0A1I5UUM5_9SPHN|nr:hypothetical protein [Sphingomonas rubra]SFP98888.1 hypothetical protein SAMN04488241_11628 [Sphingomonas rubra]
MIERQGLYDLAEALARLAVKRDIAAARKERINADASLRPVFQPAPEVAP